MGERVRVGLVGAGIAAQAIHVPVLGRRPDLFSVTAVCDPSAAARDTVADRCGVGDDRRFARVEELLEAGGVDALLVLTSGSHGAICVGAAGAGLPVFCEKPLAYTIAEADNLERASSVLALGYMKVYDAAVRRAAELLDGRSPRSIEVVVLHPPPAAQLAHLTLVRPDDVPASVRANLEAEEQRLLEEALGAAPADAKDLYRRRILGSIVHDLAVVRVLAGNPVGWDQVDAWPPGELDSVALQGRLESGGRLSIRWHYLADYPVYREDLYVHDERGTVQVTFPSPYGLNPAATLAVVDHDGGGQSRRSQVTFRTSPFEEELTAFHRLVTEGRPTAAGIEEGRADIISCQRAVRLFCETSGLPVGAEALAA
jgi:myo-inositol 2-dehydrogenase / D-chiro-inositol 1-dehydrogenase